MSELSLYTDEHDITHILVVVMLDYIGKICNEFVTIPRVYESRLTAPIGYEYPGGVYWVNNESMQCLDGPIELNTWGVIDIDDRLLSQSIGHYVYNYMHIDQLIRNMNTWLSHIPSDIVTIIIEYAFDLQHIPKDAH